MGHQNAHTFSAIIEQALNGELPFFPGDQFPEAGGALYENIPR